MLGFRIVILRSSHFTFCYVRFCLELTRGLPWLEATSDQCEPNWGCVRLGDAGLHTPRLSSPHPEIISDFSNNDEDFAMIFAPQEIHDYFFLCSVLPWTFPGSPMSYFCCSLTRALSSLASSHSRFFPLLRRPHSYSFPPLWHSIPRALVLFLFLSHSRSFPPSLPPSSSNLLAEVAVDQTHSWTLEI